MYMYAYEYMYAYRDVLISGFDAMCRNYTLIYIYICILYLHVYTLIYTNTCIYVHIGVRVRGQSTAAHVSSLQRGVCSTRACEEIF
jgi:hypothetical protein